MRMLHIVIYDLSGLTLFFTLSNKRHDFLENIIEHKMCVLIFCTNCLQHFSFSEELSEIKRK
jgi:hypothetical protein